MKTVLYSSVDSQDEPVNKLKVNYQPDWWDLSSPLVGVKDTDTGQRILAVFDLKVGCMQKKLRVAQLKVWFFIGEEQSMVLVESDWSQEIRAKENT